MTPIIFLDIDGVLIAYPEGEHTPPQVTLRCVEAFKSILAAVPRARVVLSSTWRLPDHVNQLHAQWLENGFPESLAWDGTPDTRGNPGVFKGTDKIQLVDKIQLMQTYSNLPKKKNGNHEMH